MKSKKLGLFLTLALVLTGAMAFAQDAPKAEESPVKVSGSTFFAYIVGAGSIDNQYSKSSLGANYFSLDRLYLNADAQMAKGLAFHVTLDAAPQLTGTSSNVTLPGIGVTTAAQIDRYAQSSTTYAYVPFVKTAYTKATFGMEDLLMIDLNLGLIDTVIIKNKAKMTDLRWITDNMYNGYANNIGANLKAPLLSPYYILAGALQGALVGGKLLGGDGDKSADLGLGIDINLVKMITLTFQVVAGEGEKAVLIDQSALNQGKAIYLDLFVEPVKGIYATGFFRHEAAKFINGNEFGNNTGTNDGLEKWFAGAGIGINLMGIKAGAGFEAGQWIYQYLANIDGTSVAKNFFVMDVYLNVNLQEIAGFPLLVFAKMTYGTYTDPTTGSYATGGKGQVWDSVNLIAGLGWQFNKNFRIAIGYDMTYFGDSEIAMALNINPYDTGTAVADAKAGKARTGLGEQANGNQGWTNSNAMIFVKTETKF
jgi:hypothetical protein